MRPSWVIGRGLLGGALASAMASPPWHTKVRWSDPEQATQDLAEGLNGFMAQVQDRPWRIFWSAGKGVPASPQSLFDVELAVFGAFLEQLSALPADVRERGSIYLASSVGGLYAGSQNPPFDENTEPSPLAPYGHAKVQMEQMVRGFSADSSVRSLVARIPNLYGTGQDMSKRQGLLSVIIASYVTGEPTSIYVPLDTLRDYVNVDDCAVASLAAMDRLEGTEPVGGTVTKIFTAMYPQSVAAILGAVARLRRVRAPIVSGQGPSQSQASDLRVVSSVWPDLDGLGSTTLPAGIDQIYRAQLASFAAGELERRTPS